MGNTPPIHLVLDKPDDDLTRTRDSSQATAAAATKPHDHALKAATSIIAVPGGQTTCRARIKGESAQDLWQRLLDTGRTRAGYALQAQRTPQDATMTCSASSGSGHVEVAA